MTIKSFRWFISFVGCSLFICSQALAQDVTVENSPRPFTVVAPASWIQKPTTTENSRIRFSAPSGTLEAECSVIVMEVPGLRDTPQSSFDRQMAEPIDSREMVSQLSSIRNNVRVFSTARTIVSGYPAQLYNVEYSFETAGGERWHRGVMITWATTPGVVWTVGCLASGQSLKEAQKAYSYWQFEIKRFSANLKVLSAKSAPE